MKQQPETDDTSAKDRNRDWAVILAGGDGTRLKSLTRKIAGDERPKQFCSVLGNRTLLEETKQRAALEVPPGRTVYVVNRAHEQFYSPILARESENNVIVQPCNRGTAPAILYSLLRIAAIGPNANIVFFPSDHYISDDRKFMGYIRSALDTIHQKPESVILLGLAPESPEVEYGWIEPGARIGGNSQIFAVRRFWEKPTRKLAEILQLRGCLWNSFVMVGSVKTLLETVESAIPDLYHSFANLFPLFGSHAETIAVNKLYESISEVNFSQQVLALRPERLAVMKVRGVRWNDLGEPKRVMASLGLAGIRPQWLDPAMPQFA